MYELVRPKVECVKAERKYGCFVIQPLERGFGTTLGNSLRRVLLSSLPGAAVTKVRMESAAHEFSVITHMKEDVIDFILNVKALRLRSLTSRDGKLVLNVEGEGHVCAADIAPSADFEVANPELHLATLQSDEAKLYVELDAEIGKGYIPASRSNGFPIGTIPVDAIFTPVSKVNYTIEPMRIGQQTGYEKLILDVWTDGTVTPREALSGASDILVDQFVALTATDEPAVEEERKAVPTISPALYDMPIEQVGLSQSIVRRLRRNKITKLGELLEKTKEDLLSLEKFGTKSVDEVDKSLQEMGLVLGRKDPSQMEALLSVEAGDSEPGLQEAEEEEGEEEQVEEVAEEDDEGEWKGEEEDSSDSNEESDTENEAE